ncbi:esterase family protein [Streptomyces sp. A1136]|uniref:alpha/beta hydrolase n=1 Tax=Streptomyces sp. A1136 TaxID=2563102 RepID=UPI00109EC766|nr:alpha/beta hydrolase-fold protein [Streptomyces sp. A1136]THA49798.1 esterase [Streptomyces sp. A1136]
MSLTSATPLLIAVLVLALTFAAVLRWWPRLAGRGWRRVAGRVGLLCLIQVLLLATVGLVANRTFLLYGSWAELAGHSKPAPPPGRAAADKPVRVLGRQATGTPGGGPPQVAGVIEKVMVHGARSAVDVPAYVYLPPEYFQKGNEDKKFPTTVVLTGFPGMAENLIKGLDYPKKAWSLVKEKKTRPMILVMLRPTTESARNTQCIDVPGGPRSETFFGTDLPKAVSATYRTTPQHAGGAARGWAVMGDSTGGYCALKLALQHPESYAAGVGLSADYKPEVDGYSGDLFHGNGAEERRSDLLWSLDHLPQGKTSFLVTTSTQGEANLKPTQKFIEKVKGPARVSSITLDHGGHNFATWRREIPPALEWISNRIGRD